MDSMTAEQALDAVHDLLSDPDGIADNMDLMIKLKNVEIFLTNVVQGNAALSAPRVPEGWVPVPVEPTDEMAREGYAHWSGESMVAIYKAMIAAAPPESDELVRLRERVAELEKDAARYQCLKDSGIFRVMSPDMNGNHSWTAVGRPIPGNGKTIDDAIDAARLSEGSD